MDEFEYVLEGSGHHTVVFLNGFRMPYSSWGKVTPSVCNKHRVLRYNRRGVGKSKKADTDQSGLAAIEELRQLLTQLDLRPPYVLVGHSLGGMYANLFARKYKDDIAAVVFIESPHEDEILEQRTIKPPALLCFVNDSIKSIEKLFDKFKYSEDEQILTTLNQLKGAGAFPEIPIAVVSGTKKMPFVPEASFVVHQRYQHALMGLSSSSTHYECKESGHFPQITEPDLTSRAVLETINLIECAV